MLFPFFDKRSIIHTIFLPPVQMINLQVCREILQHIFWLLSKKIQELWQDNLWLLHYDDAPVPNTQRILHFLAKRMIPVLEQPPDSPDLALRDFFLFTKTKGIIKGTHFEDVEAIKRAIMVELRGIPEKSFQQCIEAWQTRMGKCIGFKWDCLV